MKRERLPLYLREVAKAFPDWCLDPAVLRMVQNKLIDVPDDLIEALCDMEIIERRMGGVDRIMTLIRACHTQDHWDNVVRKFYNHDKFPLRETGFRLLRFPPQPFPDTPQLTALNTLHKYRRELGIIYSEYRIRAGRAYVYHWSGAEEAAVIIEREIAGPWTIYWIRPCSSEGVSTETRREIRTALSEALGERFAAHIPETLGERSAEHIPDEDNPPASTPRRFPLQPFPDTPLLTALTRARALKSEGYKMRNCCFSYTDEVRQGSFYFYHWCGKEEVTVALKRPRWNAEVWRIFDLRKVGGRKPSTGTRQKIIAALAEVLGERFTQPVASNS